MRRLMAWIRARWGRPIAAPTPAPHVFPPAPPAHALDAACQRFGCRYDRMVFPTGEVQVRLVRADGTLAAVAPTTAQAIVAVLKKADQCWEPL